MFSCLKNSAMMNSLSCNISSYNRGLLALVRTSQMLFQVAICLSIITRLILSCDAYAVARQADAISVDGFTVLPPETPGLQESSTIGAVSVDGLTTMSSEPPGLQSATITGAVSVDGPVSTLPPESPGLQTQAATLSNTSHGGAIAGGIVGAIVVAAIAAVLLLRYRNKRSPRHWRNRIRNGALGPLSDQWPSREFKSEVGSSGNQGSHFNGPTLNDHKSPIASPTTAKFTTPFIIGSAGASRRSAENIEMQNSSSGK
ncbi:hypothetical protein GYMLUDRAFT_851601 [Collybiopsis luxurians FD-317 M1]|nr:hypothetical protein GYMLUDRAFT_851601 [Collybiopsis luxurians FD-317 M1]